MATDVEICNIALSHFGENRISALSEAEATSDENVAKCLVFYPQARRELLADYRWSFATKTEAAAALVDTPLLKWTYQFTMPSGLLRLLSVHGGTTNTETAVTTYDQNKLEDFEILDGRLLCNYAKVAFKFVYDNTDTQSWSDHACSACARLLASYLAESVTGDPARGSRHYEIYKTVDLPRAQHLDAIQTRSNENHPLNDRLRRSAMNQRRRLGVLGVGQHGDPDS